MKKRLFDLITSIFIIILLSWLFVLISILIKMFSKGPVFYTQIRVGLNGVLFHIFKFRTMIVNNDKVLITVSGDKRITKIGKILRKYKLDELPQLFNVVKGDMSLVGPRPEVVKYVNLYPHDIKNIVLSVRPGITEWAAIHMINESIILAKSKNPEQTYINEIMPLKLKYSIQYVQNQKLILDVKIIFITILRILKL